MAIIPLIQAIGLRKATNEQLKEYTKATKRNATRRAQRLREQGIDTDAVHEVLRNSKDSLDFRNKSRQELQKEASLWRDLDQDKGTRAATAPMIAERETRRIDRLKEIKAPQINTMDRQQLERTYQTVKKTLQNQLGKVENVLGAESYASSRFELFLGEEKQNPTHQQLRSYISQLRDILNLNSATIKGAEEQLDQGVEIFGDQFKKWNKEERTAVWGEVKRQVTEANVKGSPEYIDYLIAATKEGKLSVSFIRDGDDITGARFGFGKTEADNAAIAEQARRETNKRVTENARDNPIFFDLDGRDKPVF